MGAMRVTTDVAARAVDEDAARVAADAVQLRALEALFEDVHRTRMHDVPILNEALRVEAFGFRDWHAARVGALVTPWSITIVALPRADAPPDAVPRVERLATGRSQIWTFPSGDYEFHGHEAPGVGHYQQCSLFSPALEFAAHSDARDAALAALDALFAAPAPPPASEPRRYSRRGFLLGA